MYKLLFTAAAALASFVGTSYATEPDGSVSGIEQGYISKTLSPADDFYEFVNEGWLKNTEIPADRSNYGSFTKIDDSAKEAIRKIIEEAASSDAAQGSEQQKIGDFYNSYMDVDTRNKLGIEPIEPLLEEVRSAATAEDMARIAGQLFRKGIGGPMAFFVMPDAKDSETYAVYVTQTGITLPDRDYYLEDEPRYKKALEDLDAYITDMMEAIGYYDPEGASERTIELETKMAGLFWDRVKNRDPQLAYNKKTSDELAEMLSNLPLNYYLDEVGLDEQESFIVRQPSYFSGLNDLIVSTEPEAWQEYFLFKIIDGAATGLTEELEKRHFDFYSKALSGVEEQLPLWRRGVSATEGVLGEALGKLYVERHFPPEAKRRMDQLVENLKKAYAKRIEELDWMTPVTKKAALEKLSKFRTKIGYPDEWKSYSDLVIESDDLVGNYFRSAEVEARRQLGKLGGPIDRNEWFMTPQTVNAYYNPTMNEIVFPAAILQPPFFNLEADDAVNYGGIGGVIGHEISHGFDDKGSQYDGDGNLRMWWSDEDRSEFETRANQLVDQYNQFEPFEGFSVNGEFTLGENIGDLGGMAVAYEAYQLSLDGEEAPVIDGLTGDQRFFLGWGQIWRRLYREKELKQRLITDPHSPSRYRCNGILSNMDAFYEAFEVPQGSGMYIAPDKRVRIW
ncbi:MAG TPA: peptidase M13 [Planctomycetaceae bacterium]|nr:peptidase M13 [Planctomycetaceae bacterium]